jgi:hypothetical protein
MARVLAKEDVSASVVEKYDFRALNHGFQVGTGFVILDVMVFIKVLIEMCEFRHGFEDLLLSEHEPKFSIEKAHSTVFVCSNLRSFNLFVLATELLHLAGVEHNVDNTLISEHVKLVTVSCDSHPSAIVTVPVVLVKIVVEFRQSIDLNCFFLANFTPKTIVKQVVRAVVHKSGFT